jgi:membrane fusion protein, multidrug efflux system
MKANIYNRLAVFFTIGAILGACSAATPEDDKKARLETLKKEQADLSKEIKALEEQIAKENPDAAKNVKAKEVTVAVVKPKVFEHYVQTQGHIESENNIMVSAKSMGVIEQVFVREGQQVSKGQVLAQIDNSVIAASIQSMQSQLEMANTVYERQKNLWDQKIGTEVQFLQAKTNKESLEKQLASLREQSEMTRIKSPIAGTVDEVRVKVGENIAPGMPAARVVNSNDLKLVANVSEAYVTSVKKGNKVLINVPEIKKEIVSEVAFVGRNIDPMSRTFTVEVNLKSLPELRPNMSATVRVVFNSAQDAIVVPVNIIQTLNNEKIVYVAEEKGKQTVARKKVVTVDGVYSNMAQVEGLKDGDRIITFGYQGLNDGEVIKI